jgi:hypothetical protein
MRKSLTLLIILFCTNLALAQIKPLACQVNTFAGLSWKNWQLKKYFF